MRPGRRQHAQPGGHHLRRRRRHRGGAGRLRRGAGAHLPHEGVQPGNDGDVPHIHPAGPLWQAARDLVHADRLPRPPYPVARARHPEKPHPRGEAAHRRRLRREADGGKRGVSRVRHHEDGAPGAVRVLAQGIANLRVAAPRDGGQNPPRREQRRPHPRAWGDHAVELGRLWRARLGHGRPDRA